MEFVGRTVRKEFEGFGVFSGVVKSYDSESGLFEIGYDDGDSEEIDLSELTVALVDADGVRTVDQSSYLKPSRVGRRPKKRSRVLVSSNSGNENGFSSSVGNVVAADQSNLDSVVVDKLTKKMDFSSHDSNNVSVCGDNHKVNDDGIDLNLNLDFIEENDLESKRKDLADCSVKEEQCLDLNMDVDGEETKNEDVDLGGYVEGENCGEDGRLKVPGDIATESPGVLGVQNYSMAEVSPVVDQNEALGRTQTRGRRGRKRKSVTDSPKTGAESVLRRSARRQAKSSVDEHDGNAVKVDDDHDDVACALPAGSSPVISAVSEDQPTSSGCKESEEPSVVPLKLELPPSTGNLNLDGLPVLDVFSVYAFLRSFSTILFLSPFELGDFVASLRSESPSLLIDSIHVSLLRTLRKLLEFQSSESLKPATNCLRDLNWDLLDLITWPIYMAEYLLMKPGFDFDQLKLFKTDYHKQPGSVKVKMLQYICDDVIEIEAISSELNRRILVGDPANLMDPDLNTKLTASKKRKATMAISGSSCMSEEVIDETVDWNSDECCLCKMDGNLICCDGCPAAYHSKCVGIAASFLPDGDWYCPECVVDKKNVDINVAKAIRGADLLGVDTHGRFYYSTCGYLVVADPCDAETSYHYYHMNELTALINTLNLLSGPYRVISNAITKHWHLYNKLYGEKSKLDSEKSGEVERSLAGSSEENLSKTGLHSSNNGYDISNRTATRKGMSQQLENGYLNFYSFARVASSVAGEWARKVPDNKTSTAPTKSLEELIVIQMKAITKISVDFCWSNIQNLSVDARKEKCGWCLACKFPTDDGICLFYMNNVSVLENYTSQVLGFDSRISRNDRLIDAMCHILYIEDRLHGLLLGPWLNPHFPKLYRKSFHEASDIASVKDLLLMLESNIWSRAFSDEWIKHVDLVVTVGSASHVVTSKLRMPSTRNVVGKKRSKSLDPEPHSSKNASSGLSLFWWRGGRLTRRLFNWKVLPCSLASKAARQGGGKKIDGILYPENSDFPKRSKALVWRASVQSAVTVEQLALQIRELDAHIKWEEIENSSHLAKMDKESIKSMRSFKKAIIRRKSSEGGVVKYLLDFGKRRFIPDTVVKHGSKIDESSSSSERKKYWVEEPYVPLFLLKPFNDKRIALKSNKTSTSLSLSTKKSSSNKDIFSYLFSKAEKPVNHLCGHCNKDVLIRDAIGCQYCEGFFHKRHVRKESGGMYTCHKCYVGETKKVAGPKKGKLGSRKTKKAKKGGKGKQPLEPQDKSKGFVVPLRRSARTAKIVSLQSKKKKKKPAKKKKKQSKSGGGKKKQQLEFLNEIEKPKGKRGRPRKINKLSFQKKRSPPTNSKYWLNGLLMSRNPVDEKDLSELAYSVPGGPPKCCLCDEPEFNSSLTYLCCAKCGDWFHGDAVGQNDDNRGFIIGFKCHKCRERPVPVCPHLNSVSQEPESGEQKNDDGANDVSVLLEQKPVDTFEEQKDLLNDEASSPNAEPVSGSKEEPAQKMPDLGPADALPLIEVEKETCLTDDDESRVAVAENGSLEANTGLVD
ncbi:DDT domain-containing protein PTM [Helianthus annuus]|uniref:Putative DNA binding,zinc ion binding,DNA binding protein n=1 Tax=Helianthus annuus TaxID=4232 RepID=A0A251T402_HELAN|nr:DDT domain-containing protein PTM [Helianthus annuus]